MEGNLKVLKMMSLPSGLSLSSGQLSQLNMSHVELMDNSNANGTNQNMMDLGKQLLDACRDGNTSEVKSLMQSGAPFTTDWLGTSPLHFAAQNGHSETTEVLLRAGVSRDTRTKVDRTPLHVASQEGHLQIVSLLLSHGADVDAKDLLRMTPLHWGVERGHLDVVECLLTNDADPNSISKFDKTPLDIAYDLQRHDMIQLLQRYSNPQNVKNRSDIKSVTTINLSNSKSIANRPTVLPNKSNRGVAKVLKTGPIHLSGINHRPPSTGVNMKQQVFTLSSNSMKKGELTVENIKKLLSGDTSSNSSSQILAALASALSSSPSPSKQTKLSEEAIQLLESQGLSIDSDTLVNSALDSGQSLNLTEAGKLTLNWIKDQRNQSSASATTGGGQKGKIITIVSDSNMQTANNTSVQSSPPVVMVSGSDQNTTESQPHALRNRKPVINRSSQGKPSVTLHLNNNRNVSVSNVNHATISNNHSNNGKQQQQSSLSSVQQMVMSDTEINLRRDVEMYKKQAENYKQLCQQKDREVERLKKLLAEAKARKC